MAATIFEKMIYLKAMCEFAERIHGSGGGKELFAQGGGRKISDLKEVLELFSADIANGNLK